MYTNENNNELFHLLMKPLIVKPFSINNIDS